MKASYFIICIMALLLSATTLTAQVTQNENPASQKQILISQMEHWKDAYISKDARNLIPLYAENACYISSHVEGLIAGDREKLIANFQNGMNFGGYIDSIEVVSVIVSCDLATMHCKYQATNNGITVNGRNLLVLRNINGFWKIVTHMTVV